ncbi:MAG: heavy-metal-associated domain-containing protein [Gemmatimonadota bacterium]
MKSLRITLALILALGLMAPTLAAQQEAAAQEGEPRQIQVTILGMSCPFCAYGVQQKLKKLEGVKELTVELKTGLATLTLEEDADISNEQLLETVEDAGFEVAKIVRNFESEFPDFEQTPGS